MFLGTVELSSVGCAPLWPVVSLSISRITSNWTCNNLALYVMGIKLFKEPAKVWKQYRHELAWGQDKPRTFGDVQPSISNSQNLSCRIYSG